MTLQEEKAWRKLAGYYFVRQPRSTIPEVEEDDTDWGKDYVYFGRGCHSILYKNGKWVHGGDGEAEEFELASVTTRVGFPGGSDSKESACNAGDP